MRLNRVSQSAHGMLDQAVVERHDVVGDRHRPLGARREGERSAAAHQRGRSGADARHLAFEFVDPGETRARHREVGAGRRAARRLRVDLGHHQRPVSSTNWRRSWPQTLLATPA